MSASSPFLPILLVHGIWDSSRDLRKLQRALKAAGASHTLAIDLNPNDGSTSLRALVPQLDAAAEKLQRASGSPQVDLIGFSMGALLSRIWVQRGMGREACRRFISISGPHAGSQWARFRRKMPGISEMKPGSDLLNDLSRDADPWGSVEVYSYYTPLDLMIIPAASSRLERVHRERKIWASSHRAMVTSPRVIGKIIRDLKD